MAVTVHLKRSTPVEFNYQNAAGEAVSFTVPACTVGGYRQALELEVSASPNRLLEQAIALCGENSRPDLEALEIEMIQEVIQAQIALYSGVDPVPALEALRTVKKKALAQHLANSSTSATS